MKQNGTVLGDVVLPPWAKGDPKEFIRVQREVGVLVRVQREVGGFVVRVQRKVGDGLVRVEREVGGVLVRVEREVGGVLVRVEREVGKVLVYVRGERCVHVLNQNYQLNHQMQWCGTYLYGSYMYGIRI